jgi:hypothetical protein
MDAGLLHALDRTKLSYRSAVHVLAAAAQSLGHDPAEIVLNRESFVKARMKFHATAAEEIKKAFAPSVPLTAHWDSEIVPGVDGGLEDRLPVLVSGDGVDKLLSVPKLPNGTGRAMATALTGALEDWGVSEPIKVLSFYTAASNSGVINGVRRLPSSSCWRYGGS